MMMSTRTPKAKPAQQDPRYLQLWLTYDWPQPTDRVPVACAGCNWSGRRARRSITVRPCPRCAGPVQARRPGARRPTAGGRVVQLADWTRNGDGRTSQPGRARRN